VNPVIGKRQKIGRVNYEAGPVHDVLRDLGPKILSVSYHVDELAERTKEIRANADFRDEVRYLADGLLTAADTMLAIVNDDPGAILSALSRSLNDDDDAVRHTRRETNVNASDDARLDPAHQPQARPGMIKR